MFIQYPLWLMQGVSYYYYFCSITPKNKGYLLAIHDEPLDCTKLRLFIVENHSLDDRKTFSSA